MTLDEITEQFKALASKVPSIGKTLKFTFDEGHVFLDMSGDTPQVSNEDKDADCNIITSLETLMDLRNGKLNPMMAVMGGKVKIKGDMGVAMKLQSLFS